MSWTEITAGVLSLLSTVMASWLAWRQQVDMKRAELQTQAQSAAIEREHRQSQAADEQRERERSQFDEYVRATMAAAESCRVRLAAAEARNELYEQQLAELQGVEVFAVKSLMGAVMDVLHTPMILRSVADNRWHLNDACRRLLSLHRDQSFWHACGASDLTPSPGALVQQEQVVLDEGLPADGKIELSQRLPGGQRKTVSHYVRRFPLACGEHVFLLTEVAGPIEAAAASDA